MGKYRSMRKAYYDLKQKPEDVRRELAARTESLSTIRPAFQIGSHPAFIMYCDEMIRSVSAIHRGCRRVERLVQKLPGVALRQYINQALVEEIHQTNEMENVHSTRKEIRESMEWVEQGRHGSRFEGMIRKYILLLGDEKIPLKSCRDMRALYDSFVLDEVLREDPDNGPDGMYFRSGAVGVHDRHDRRIHEGVFPESAINEAMEHALDFLNNEEYDLFIRVAAFHYLFGYIHPFYDGNGRMSRFISSYLLSEGDVPLPVCLRLSYVIKNRRKEYYDQFKETNDRHNYGDMTGFVIFFLRLIQDTCEQTAEYLEETAASLQRYRQLLKARNMTKSEQDVLFVLIQTTVCSEHGLGAEELRQLCGMGRNRLLNTMKAISPWCVMWKEGNKHLYRADLEKLNECMEQGEQ